MKKILNEWKRLINEQTDQDRLLNKVRDIFFGAYNSWEPEYTMLHDEKFEENFAMLKKEAEEKCGINVNSFLRKEAEENPDAANYDCDAKDCLSLIEEELISLGQTPSGRFEKICGAKFVQGELLDGCDDYACPHLKWVTGGAAQ